MKKSYILFIVAILINQSVCIKLFSLRKKKGGDDKECNIKVGEKCELYEGGKHNCEEGL